MTITTYLTEVEQRIGKATRGDWYVTEHYIRSRDTAANINAAVCECWNGGGPNLPDADLIAHAPTDLKTLIAVVRKQMEALNRDCFCSRDETGRIIKCDACKCLEACDAMVGGGG